MMEERIVGDRIVLRRWHESHLHQLRDIASSSLEHIATFMSSAASEIGDPDAFLVLVREAWDDGEVFAYAIEEGDRVVGHITFAPKPPGGVIGCWIRVEDIGRGLAASALRDLVKVAFLANPEITHIDASCNSANAASSRLLERAGFECIFRRPWQPRTPLEADEEQLWRVERS